MAKAVTIPAHAKINLALSVGPPLPAGDPDAGMHPIASWMAPIDLADTVTVAPGKGEGIDLDRHWATDAPLRSNMTWAAEQDLTVRALVLLGEHVGRPLGGTITVEKRIPVGGGLGGGSSDAAACLLAANRAYRLGLEIEELVEIGARLGSDVPFFLDDARPEGPPRPGLVTQLGRKVERFPLEPTPLLLVLPPFGCETAAVYDAFDEAPVTLDEAGVARLASAGTVETESLFNDLLPAARKVERRLAELLKTLKPLIDSPVHLSGSGSTLFLVTEDAQWLADDLSIRIGGPAFVVAGTLNPSLNEGNAP
ncbi:MAG: 4-(cytidine 5'-diphospho)-2-C-methyl-D-erythritol kinase [Phycisphaerales bacterium]